MKVCLPAALLQTQDGEKAALCTPIFVDLGDLGVEFGEGSE